MVKPYKSSLDLSNFYPSNQAATSEPGALIFNLRDDREPSSPNPGEKFKSTIPQECNLSLKPNPFTTYRDPETGRWIVVKP